jgi:hypothetical protein
MALSRLPFLLASLAILAAASPAEAQRRTDFEAAVLNEAATETAPNQCDDDGTPRPVRAIAREHRARMLGRAIPVPSIAGDARTRRLGLVRIATDRTDANDDLAYRLMVVLLAGSGRSWMAIGHTEIPLGDAPFDYEDTLIRIARTEDIDDDGEQELLVVLESQTEVQCGTGYCSLRATAVLDVADTSLALVASVRTQSTCQAEVVESERGTTSFRDTDGDGHRDFVVRTQHCDAAEFDDDTAEYRDPVCQPTVTVVHRWDASTDRYLAPVPLSS